MARSFRTRSCWKLVEVSALMFSEETPKLRRSLGSSRRRGLARNNVEFRVRYAHHPLIEPTHDVLKTFDTMPGLARPRELVRLPGKNNHGGGTFQILKRTEQLLAARILRRAEVRFAQHKKHWRMEVLDKRNRRSVPIVLWVFKRRCFEPTRLEEHEICRVPPRCPIGNVALRHRRRKTVGMGDGPVGEHTATAA